MPIFLFTLISIAFDKKFYRQPKDKKLYHPNVNHTYSEFAASEDPCINESGAASLEGSGQRQRRLSYTLDEPSPVLLAYMERFGQTSTDQIEVCHFDEILSSIFF